MSPEAAKPQKRRSLRWGRYCLSLQLHHALANGMQARMHTKDFGRTCKCINYMYAIVGSLLSADQHS